MMAITPSKGVSFPILRSLASEGADALEIAQNKNTRGSHDQIVALLTPQVFCSAEREQEALGYHARFISSYSIF